MKSPTVWNQVENLSSRTKIQELYAWYYSKHLFVKSGGGNTMMWKCWHVLHVLGILKGDSILLDQKPWAWHATKNPITDIILLLILECSYELLLWSMRAEDKRYKLIFGWVQNKLIEKAIDRKALLFFMPESNERVKKSSVCLFLQYTENLNCSQKVTKVRKKTCKAKCMLPYFQGSASNQDEVE